MKFNFFALITLKLSDSNLYRNVYFKCKKVFNSVKATKV